MLRLARRSLETFLRDGSVVNPPEAPASLRARMAAFVTLRTRTTQVLRGCRGDIWPTRALGESVITSAIAAASDDPRFTPVRRDELPELTIQLSLLTRPRPIHPSQVILGEHGLLLRHPGASALLLPQVPALLDIESVEAFLETLCQKAELPRGSWRDPAARLDAFQALCFGEDDLSAR